MAALRKKSLLLTSYMEYLLTNKDNSLDSIITLVTPSNPEERGAQLSLMFAFDTKNFFVELQKRGVVVDERKPNVIRSSAVPIYNSFTDVYKFYKYVKESYRITFPK